MKGFGCQISACGCAAGNRVVYGFRGEAGRTARHGYPWYRQNGRLSRGSRGSDGIPGTSGPKSVLVTSQLPGVLPNSGEDN